jgi:hypothetical protein
MKALCPNCGAIGHISDSKILQRGAYLQCPRCRARFLLSTDRRSGKDRRSGSDRRVACPFFYRGTERRSGKDRRRKDDRRAVWVRVEKWSIAGGKLVPRNVGGGKSVSQVTLIRSSDPHPEGDQES